MADEPPCLRGGSTPIPIPSVGEGFDAYCATIHANPDAVLDDLFVLLDSAGLAPVIREGLKARFYAVNRQVVDDKGQQLIALKSGGQNPHPHLECYGGHSGLVAAYLRERYGHQPTRIDHAIDCAAPGLFDQLHEFAKALAARYGLKLAYGGDWNTPDAGRTIYLGSRASQVFVRFYEKGLKYAHDLGEPITDDLRNWVRIELEFKPDTKVAKALAPSIEGVQMWGSTEWTQEVAREVLGMNVERVTIRERRESDHERALRFMAKQYAKHLRILLKKHDGDFCEFGRAIGVLAGLSEADD